MSIDHIDGSEVVVFDAQGRIVPAVDEVRLQHDRAAVAVHEGGKAWLAALLHAFGPQATPVARIIDARSGHEHWCGPVHISPA